MTIICTNLVDLESLMLYTNRAWQIQISATCPAFHSILKMARNYNIPYIFYTFFWASEIKNHLPSQNLDLSRAAGQWICQALYQDSASCLQNCFAFVAIQQWCVWCQWWFQVSTITCLWHMFNILNIWYVYCISLKFNRLMAAIMFNGTKPFDQTVNTLLTEGPMWNLVKIAQTVSEQKIFKNEVFIRKTYFNY